jgi:N-acetylglucosamine-6-phosphate deacetylase
VTVGLIVDGRHVHPLLVKLARQILGPRLNLVSDAMAALGLPPGEYRLGDFTVSVGDDARLSDGTLAGSILAPDQAARNLVEYSGCSSAQAVAALSAVPARLLGLPKGLLTPGYDADLVLLSPDMRVRMTIVGGEIAYDAAESLPWK